MVRMRTFVATPEGNNYWIEYGYRATFINKGKFEGDIEFAVLDFLHEIQTKFIACVSDDTCVHVYYHDSTDLGKG